MSETCVLVIALGCVTVCLVAAVAWSRIRAKDETIARLARQAQRPEHRETALDESAALRAEQAEYAARRLEEERRRREGGS